MKLRVAHDEDISLQQAMNYLLQQNFESIIIQK